MSNHLKGGMILAHSTLQGESGAMDVGKLLSLYGNDLLRICFLYLRDYHMAEDALQDTFEKAIRAFPRFRGECAEKTWLTRIAINVCKNKLRAPWHKRRVDDADFCARLAETKPTEEGENSESLALAISKLSPKYKEVVLLFYYEEMQLKEIAGTLHIPEATVSTRLLRAREELRRTAKEWYYDE